MNTLSISSRQAIRPVVRFVACLLVAPLILIGCATNKAPKLDPQARTKQVESHFRLGLDALQKNNLPKAFDELLHAEQIDPKRADVLDALGYAWRLRGDNAQAQAYYKRSLAEDPSARTWNNYGSLLLSMKQPKQAEAAFRKALDDPRYNRPDLAYINLGDALLMQDNFDDAIAAYRHAHLLNPNQELSRLKEAAAYREHDRPEFARAMYETILRDAPANKQAVEGLIGLLQDPKEIRSQLEAFIAATQEPLDRAWAEETLKGMQP